MILPLDRIMEIIYNPVVNRTPGDLSLKSKFMGRGLSISPGVGLPPLILTGRYYEKTIH